MRAVKTVLMLFAVIIMSVCFAACGGEDEPTPDPGDTPETFTVHSIDGLETLGLTITDGAYRTSIVGEIRLSDLFMIGFEDDDADLMDTFMDEVEKSSYAIGSYDASRDGSPDGYDDISRYVLLEKDGYGYVAMAREESCLVYVRQRAVTIRAHSETGSTMEDYFVSVPMPFYRFHYLDRPSEELLIYHNGSTLTVTWTAESFEAMCSPYDVQGDYYSVKEYYLGVSDVYDITFDDDTKTIHMNCSRIQLDMSLLFEYDIVSGSTLTFTDDTVTLVMDAGVQLY